MAVSFNRKSVFTIHSRYVKLVLVDVLVYISLIIFWADKLFDLFLITFWPAKASNLPVLCKKSAIHDWLMAGHFNINVSSVTLDIKIILIRQYILTILNDCIHILIQPIFNYILMSPFISIIQISRKLLHVDNFMLKLPAINLQS